MSPNNLTGSFSIDRQTRTLKIKAGEYAGRWILPEKKFNIEEIAFIFSGVVQCEFFGFDEIENDEAAESLLKKDT